MSQEKLSIYPGPAPKVVLVEDPNPLIPHVKVVRETVSDIFGDARVKVDSTVDKWVKLERRVEREVKSVLPKDEPLTPGILYVGVAGLAGSVLARNRNILLRLTLPPLLFVSAAPYFLPKTSHNVRQYLSRVEDAHFPELAAQHNQLNRQLSSTFSSAVYRAEHLSEDVRGLGGKISHSIEDTTGLKIGDAIGRANHVKSDVMSEIEKRRAAEQFQATAAVQQARSVDAKPVAIITEEIPVAEVVAIKQADVKTSPAVAQKKLV